MYMALGSGHLPGGSRHRKPVVDLFGDAVNAACWRYYRQGGLESLEDRRKAERLRRRYHPHG